MMIDMHISWLTDYFACEMVCHFTLTWNFSHFVVFIWILKLFWRVLFFFKAAYQAGEDEICLSAMGRSYTVDFNSMQQINEDTGTARPVQRKINPLLSNSQQALGELTLLDGCYWSLPYIRWQPTWKPLELFLVYTSGMADMIQ